MQNTPLANARGSFVALMMALVLTSTLVAADPVKKPAASLDDELFQGLDDATKAPGVKPTPSATGDNPTSPQPTKPSPQPSAKSSNPLDDELLKSLGGDDGPPAKKPEQTKSGDGPTDQGPPGGDAPETQPSDDPFERIAQQIRDAQNRLRRIDSGDKTQELQRKIIDDLEQLIAKIEQEQQQQQQQQSQSQSQPKPQSKSQPQPKPGQPQPQPGSEQDSDKARDSQDGTRSSKTQKPDPGRLQSLLEKAWGSLPERERQDVMQSSVDDFPTKYQAVIEEYFKTLLRREE